MAWGVLTDVSAPVEMYDAVHAEVLRRAGTTVDGLLVHIARPTARGFQIIEVWESQADFERYQEQLIGPAVAAVSARMPDFAAEPHSTEFDVRGLLLPRDGVLA